MKNFLWTYFGFIKDRESGNTYLKKVRRSEKEKKYVSDLKKRERGLLQ